MSQDRKSAPGEESRQGAKVESILAQWRRERPDIDPEPMAVCGQIWQVGERLRQGVVANWSNWGLDFSGSDVLLTLRRQGRGTSMSPSALARDMMLSTSAMTNRIDRLEGRGLLRRRQDPDDRRGVRIELTDEGFDLVDRMIVSHVETEEGLIAALSEAERRQLRKLLAKIGA